MSAIVDLVLGIVTSIGGFVEAGSISTASQAGAEFGFQLLWAIAGATLMLAMLIEMSGRLAAVSKRSLAAAVRERFGIHFQIVPLTAELMIDVLLLAAEIGGTAIAVKLLTGIGFQWWILPIGVAVWLVLWLCEEDEPGARVELRLIAVPEGTRVTVTEAPVGPFALAGA